MNLVYVLSTEHTTICNILDGEYISFFVHILFFSCIFFKIFCSSYQNNDINEFEKILKTNRRNIMEDPFIREHIEGKHWRPFLYSFSHSLCTWYRCHINVKYMKGTTLLLDNLCCTCSLFIFTNLVLTHFMNLVVHVLYY